MKLFHVYVDYTTEENPRAFYVGKGNETRIKNGDRNQYWKSIKKKYGWNRVIEFSHTDEQLVFQREVELIRHYKTFADDWDDGSGWGANFTRGGEGQSGKKYTPEQIEKLREAHRGILHTEETKKKIAEANLRRGPRSEGTKDKIRTANTGRIHTDEVKEACRQRMTGARNHQYGKTGELSANWGKKGLTIQIGSKNGNTTLKEDDVLVLRKMFDSGSTITEIYKSEIPTLHGISRHTVADIVKRRTWKHLL